MSLFGSTLISGCYRMGMTTTRHAVVTLETVYSDGSGAPAVVCADGQFFAVDFVGEMRVTSHATGRRIPKRTIALAKSAYMKALRSRVGAEWFALNAAMYAGAQ